MMDITDPVTKWARFKVWQLVALLLLMSAHTKTFAATWQITYPSPASETDQSADYPLAVLSLALNQTGVNYQLIPSVKHYSQSKNLNRLKDNREINVVWSMTDKQREEELLPIRIPIYKGLIGWRLFLIREDMQERFKYIQNLEQLLKLNPVQGSDWPDTKILQANGFDTVTNLNYNALFEMLSSAQGDFFPRSLIEIWYEIDSVNTENKLIIEPSKGIRYPAAIYFFLNKKNRPLANLITIGLEKAIENGEFEQLFSRWHASYINNTQFKKRTFYELENTFLPPATPLDRKELWFSLPSSRD